MELELRKKWLMVLQSDKPITDNQIRLFERDVKLISK